MRHSHQSFFKFRACQRELKYALELQRTPLPVRMSAKVSPESLPPDLSELQWVDYSRPDKQALKSLQRTLRYLPKAPPLPDPLPDAPAVPISYLSNLRSKIECDSQLQFQDQIQLVFEFRTQFRNGDFIKEILDLLQRLKKRDDLFAKVAQEIDYLIRDIGRKFLIGDWSPPPEPEPPGPVEDGEPPNSPFAVAPVLSEPPIEVAPIPLEPAIAAAPICPERSVLDQLVPPSVPEVMPGTGGGRELLEVKKPISSPSPTKALFISAVFAIGVGIFAVYLFFAPGNKSATSGDNEKQASLAVTQGDSGKRVTASPAEKAPSPAINTPLEMARSPVINAPAMQETAFSDLGLTLTPASVGGVVSNGMVVSTIEPDGVAAQKGLELGDVIIEVGGRAVNQPADVEAALSEVKKNNRKAVLLRVKNSDGTHFVAIAVMQGDSGKSVIASPAEKALGMEFSSLTDELRQKFAIENSVTFGVVVTDVDPYSDTAKKRVEAGDVIMEINGENVKEPADIAMKLQVLKRVGKKSALLLVANGQGEMRFVMLRLP